jgi:hypothetical protein
MIAVGLLFIRMLCDCFKSRRRLEAEILVLRHQLSVLQQRMPGRVHLRWADARMMGGDVTVTSELGKGSVFTVRVPGGADTH